MTVRPSLPLKRKPSAETFNWYIKPEGGLVDGQVYPDGSARDGPTPEIMRLGWAFAVLGNNGMIIAAAYGVPPPWIVDIGGAEAWALYQAFLCTSHQLSKYWPDCYPVKVAIDKGPHVAKDPRNALARIHGMLHAALEGCDGKVVGWMPSHLTKVDLSLGTATKSDGSLVSAADIMANDVADKLATLGVEYHRVPQEEVRRWKLALNAAKARAKWIGMATHASNNHPLFPFRDSEASRWKAVAAQRKRMERKAGIDIRKKRGAKMQKKAIPTAKGGHSIELAQSGHCWMCTACRGRSTSWSKLATSKCDGAKSKALTTIAVESGHEEGGGGRKHNFVTSGTVHWCETCGCCAESRTSNRMKDACPGPPPAAAGNGGMKQQRMSLRAGIHPVTGLRLPEVCGSSAHDIGAYSQLKPGTDSNDDFEPYVPATFEPPVPSGASAERKRWLMRGRLLCKIGKEAAGLRRQRRTDAKEDVGEVIRSYICAANNDAQAEEDGIAAGSSSSIENLGLQTCERVELAGDDSDSDEEFWSTLPTTDSRTKHIQNLPTQPDRSFPGRAVRSRMVASGMGCEPPRKGY